MANAAAIGDCVARRDRRILVALAAVLAWAVLAWPFTKVHYPPLTDLPFHAAQTSIFRHYFDPSYHFREQFTLHPLEVPYDSMYFLGAFFALFFSIATATKLMAIAMLALVPAGLAVFFHGARKDPLLGLTGLALTWCTVTQWGFLNFMGAFGLFMMSLGFALRVVDEPTVRRQWALALTLVALFFTHVYRVPFAILGVVAAGAAVYPVTRRFRALVGPLLPALALFSIWIMIRPRGLGISGSLVGFHPERFAEIPRHLFGAYTPMEGCPQTPEGTSERGRSIVMLAAVLVAMAAATLAGVRRNRVAPPSPEEKHWRLAVTILPVAGALGLLALYFTLPLEAGKWFYVYPREIVGAALLLFAAIPDLPRSSWPRAGFGGLVAVASLPMASFVGARFSEFEGATADFRAITAQIPQAPKLFYLMYWLGDSAKRATPFLHLPAWVQAEKGGALGFHFVQWNHSPIRYREGSEDVPPRTPPRFEWTPQYFRVLEHGKWFDTFLVRHRQDPSVLFAQDPSIHLVSHEGTWWLYRRQP
jgi:hypothetical protein